MQAVHLVKIRKLAQLVKGAETGSSTVKIRTGATGESTGATGSATGTSTGATGSSTGISTGATGSESGISSGSTGASTASSGSTGTGKPRVAKGPVVTGHNSNAKATGGTGCAGCVAGCR